MTWNPLKKLQRHGSKPYLLQGDEILLEKHVTQLDQLENSTKKLHKDAKKYEDMILDVNRDEKKITTDLSSSLLCDQDDKFRSLIEEWHSYILKAAAYDDDLVLLTQRTVVEPLKKFQRIFSETKNALKKREEAMQECIKYNQKVQKLQEKEKTGHNIVKLETAKQTLANLEEDFKGRDKLLKSELPRLYEAQIDYFQPCLEAVIKAQIEHSGNTAGLIADVIPSLRDFTTSESSLKHIQNKRFTEIQSLSIVEDY